MNRWLCCVLMTVFGVACSEAPSETPVVEGCDPACGAGQSCVNGECTSADAGAPVGDVRDALVAGPPPVRQGGGDACVVSVAYNEGVLTLTLPDDADEKCELPQAVLAYDPLCQYGEERSGCNPEQVYNPELQRPRAAELIEIDAQTGRANLSDQLAAFELIVEVGESCTIEERACTFVDASGVRVGTGVLDCHMSGGAFHAVGHATDANGVQIVTCPSN